MIELTRYLLDWPRNEKGEVIFRNTHEAYFYATMFRSCMELMEEIKGLLEITKRDLHLEREKPTPNRNRMILLACRHQFYKECIDEANRLLQEQYK